MDEPDRGDDPVSLALGQQVPVQALLDAEGLRPERGQSVVRAFGAEAGLDFI